ncbi:MAG: hypothetical protein UW64_C0008G0013 [Microgenomates group bacterium GW2011_GWC1_44_37]|nr:MAG: hypothetical protein UW42_C0004G0010 [Candidatus Collierbacteria bacterium GW2011_GWB1_44_197]KKT61827.1 MAG: hypothetical protein UW56_C0017G0010 [Candidatus Collierbacteria bacterium GW2011_GWD1_44_27]KKT68869.1 MAG: hypothetical protein UW64_C0008G0013 [Microgenomates group bacterium GW2011_GWC1_44_37]
MIKKAITPTTVLIILSFFLQLFYLGKTPYNTRTYDVLEGGGHLDYIAYVYQNHTVPPAEKGWQYHHPPLYYFLSSLPWSLSNFFPFEKIYLLLQFISVCYYTGFLFISILIFKELLPRGKTIILASALLCFWPSGIIHSVRIGNDTLYYLLFSVSLFFLIRWWENPSQNLNLLLSSVFASLTILTKSNGIVLIILLTISALTKLTNLKSGVKYLAIVFVTLVITFISFLPRFQSKLNDSSIDWLNSSVHLLNKDLAVTNTANNLLFLDINSYLTHPFTSTWSDDSGRQSFWNFLLKSSLFGEFSFEKPISILLAHSLSLMLLVFLTISITNIFFGFSRAIFLNPIIVGNLLINLAALYYFRLKLPFAPHADFRYIYPILVSFIFFLLPSSFQILNNKFLRNFTFSILWAFPIISIIFFLTI